MNFLSPLKSLVKCVVKCRVLPFSTKNLSRNLLCETTCAGANKPYVLPGVVNQFIEDPQKTTQYVLPSLGKEVVENPIWCPPLPACVKFLAKKKKKPCCKKKKGKKCKKGKKKKKPCPPKKKKKKKKKKKSPCGKKKSKGKKKKKKHRKKKLRKCVDLTGNKVDPRVFRPVGTFLKYTETPYTKKFNKKEKKAYKKRLKKFKKKPRGPMTC